MRGLMADYPLLISSIIKHVDKHHADTEIVSRLGDGSIHRYTYREAHSRCRRLANALNSQPTQMGDRIATLAWNSFRHLEIYYAAAGSGRITHTINPRLFPDQIAWIINDAEDKMLFFEPQLLPLIEGILPALKSVPNLVVMTDRSHMPKASSIPTLLCYEDLIDSENDSFEWPELDENMASGLCYTSGTTGNPKGVLYSHRSTVLHAMIISMPDSMCLSARDTVMPVVPMFHVNAWGIPYAAPLVGAKLVLPGAALDGKSLYELFEQEKVTISAGVPTIWLALLQFLDANGLKFSTFERTVIGGSACPESMIRTFEDKYGVQVHHAWGMTELSPMGSLSKLKGKQLDHPKDKQDQSLRKQGRVVPFVDWKIVDSQGKELEWDGQTPGNLMVKAPWVISQYFKGGGSALVDGWFPTGDVATIDEHGYMQITDRSKDVIKSGGEWIGSIELENLAMAHPAVQEAAVIACHHPKWDERPLLVVVKKSGSEVTREELLKFYEGKIAKWWIPDDAVFVDQIPHTATGKLQKVKLREQFRDHKLPNA
jgi:fatty-acyl-CoA synthase